MWSIVLSTSTICCMKTFTDGEIKLIRKLQEQPPGTILRIQQPCPLHSYCNPLPLFRVYKVNDGAFEAQWNDYHKPGVRQTFQFGAQL